jgi:hypothetical protein
MISENSKSPPFSFYAANTNYPSALMGTLL